MLIPLENVETSMELTALRDAAKTSAGLEKLHKHIKRKPLIAVIVGSLVIIAALDLWTFAVFVVSILFTVPIALCALQSSRLLLWSTAAIAGILTMAAAFWGFNLIEPLNPLLDLINRSLIVASLFTLAAFIHLWINKAQKADFDALEIKRQSSDLLALNGQLELLVVAASGDMSMRRDAEQHLAQSEGGRHLVEAALRESESQYQMLLDGVKNYAIFMMDPQGQIVSWNAGAERIKGYSADQIIGHNFACFFPPADIQRGKPAETLRITAANGRYEEQSIRVRKDGSQFLASITFTALRDAAGKLRGFSEFSHDLSEKTESEAKYRGLLEAAPDAMVVVNPAGEIVLLNLQAEKQFGYRNDELVGQKVTNIIPEGFAERLQADGRRSAADALAQQIGTGIELTGRRKDGSTFPIEIMLSPLQNAQGILVTAAIRDISLRKEAENHLAQMESRYRGLLEAAPDAMVVVNQSGEIVLLNLQAENQFGYRRDELVGQQVKNIIPAGFAERLLADDLRSAEDALAQQIGTGIELTGRRKDGSTFPIEIMLSPLESSDGILVTAAIRDISLRKDADMHLTQMIQELSVKHQLLNSIVESTTDPIYVRDLDNRFVLVNHSVAKLFSRSVNDLLGMSMRELLSNETYQAVLLSDQEVIRDGIPRTLEEVAMIDGVTRHFLTTKCPYLDAQQRTVGTIGIAREITERKAAEAHLVQKMNELKRSNEDLEQFAYIASHDLQEPLRMVASYTQLLSKRYKGKLDADADEFIGFASDGAHRMQRMIQDMLTYSRVGSHVKELRKIDSETALQAALTNLDGAIKQSGAVVTHDPLPGVLADEGQLIQLFQNLIGNGIKYQTPGAVPRLHISADKNVDMWSFSVRDNGLGIEPQYFEKIFGMFQRLHKRDAYDGTGIGLAICKKIVERHGGTISIESEPGQGSTFRFTLIGNHASS